MEPTPPAAPVTALRRRPAAGRSGVRSIRDRAVHSIVFIPFQSFHSIPFVHSFLHSDPSILIESTISVGLAVLGLGQRDGLEHGDPLQFASSGGCVSTMIARAPGPAIRYRPQGHLAPSVPHRIGLDPARGGA